MTFREEIISGEGSPHRFLSRGALGRCCLGMKCWIDRSGGLAFGGGPMQAPQRLMSPFGSSLCPAHFPEQNFQGPRLLSGWEGDILAAWIPSHQPHRNNLPHAPGTGSPWAGEFLCLWPLSPPPHLSPTHTKKFHGGHFLPAFRKKHFVLSFRSSERLGISVSSDCTVLGPW